MTTTTDIARAHGYTGPTNCQDCDTTERVHFGSWYDPKTGESGDFIRCCACDITAGAPAAVHADCAAPTPDDSDVRVFHRVDGWTLSPSQTPEACTSNHDRESAGMPPCTDTAVWKVVELRDMGATLSFWCDGDLPAERRHLAPSADA